MITAGVPLPGASLLRVGQLEIDRNPPGWRPVSRSRAAAVAWSADRYPAALKTAIDWHFTQWDGKIIGFVGYGGNSGGLLAIEHLRQVFNELNAHTVRNYVYFPERPTHRHLRTTGALIIRGAGQTLLAAHPAQKSLHQHVRRLPRTECRQLGRRQMEQPSQQRARPARRHAGP